MSFEKLQQLAASITQAVENNKQFAIPFLTAKIAHALEQNPHDQTLGMLNRVLTKMSDNKKTFIKKADLQSLYNKLHTFGTTAGETLSAELGLVKEPDLHLYPREPNEEKSLEIKSQDTALSGALGNSFNHLSPVQSYSNDVAEASLKLVRGTLDAWNLKPSKISLSNGNDKFLVVKADYDTPKGLTSFLVPLEIKNGKVLQPQVLVSNAGPLELNYSNIKNYLTKNAGAKSKIGSADLLNAITLAANGGVPELSDTEMALTRLNAARQSTYGAFDNQILGQKIAEAGVKDVELPKSDEFVSFEKQFSTPQGLASWKFGGAVSVARNHIARELNSLGYRNHQIVVSDNDKDTIFYGVSINTGKTAFIVPVKVKEGQIQKPAIMLCNGSISTFDKAGINELVQENYTDVKVASVASVMANLRPTEILDNLRVAIAENNYVKAEDALNVLANSNDSRAYATALSLYMNGLADKTSEKIATTKCSKMIKNAVSEHPICSHTGLPVNKVYQDKDGNCRPLYRQGMAETYEGASFLNAKIFG